MVEVVNLSRNFTYFSVRLPDATKTFQEKSYYWKGLTQKASYLWEPFPALTCSSMPENLICISILAKLVCGSNAQRSLTWWASLGRKRQLPLRRAARLLNKVCGRETPLKVKASCHSCRWLVSLRLHFITSEFSTDLKGIALIGFISNTNTTFLQPKLRWNDLRRSGLTSSSASDAKILKISSSSSSYSVQKVIPPTFGCLFRGIKHEAQKASLKVSQVLHRCNTTATTEDLFNDSFLITHTQAILSSP